MYILYILFLRKSFLHTSFLFMCLSVCIWWEGFELESRDFLLYGGRPVQNGLAHFIGGLKATLKTALSEKHWDLLFDATKNVRIQVFRDFVLPRNVEKMPCHFLNLSVTTSTSDVCLCFERRLLIFCVWLLAVNWHIWNFLQLETTPH